VTVMATPARALVCLLALALVVTPDLLRAQAKDLMPFQSTVYNVAFGYPKKDWIAVPAAGGNIALVMHKKAEASLALDYQVLRVALEPDEIDDTFKEIEVEALTQRAPHARVVASELTEMSGRKVVIIRYGAAGLTGDLDVTQYSVVEGAALYRLTCAVARSKVRQHATVCDSAAQSMAINQS
jgi:hypothetical protein